MPPSFSLNNYVFILRLKDGTYAVIQLRTIPAKGRKVLDDHQL